MRTFPSKRPLQELNIVLVIIMRKRLNLFFGELAKKIVDSIMILFPVGSPGSDVHRYHFFLTIFGDVAEIDILPPRDISLQEGMSSVFICRSISRISIGER